MNAEQFIQRYGLENAEQYIAEYELNGFDGYEVYAPIVDITELKQTINNRKIEVTQ
ncbi:hypothetical protein F900_01842 [Acinetobacter modestus]|uniref:Uncharacterized protein n=1 Tax=Acinetobacter modestus TaxID=1776740 RepID=N9LWZ9_9GAMM|nr:hypothetical protein [Acinetobacter modestus]ENX00858.1 hypothetical protein F900_01842 [Acinetobacter modestus]